MFYDLLKNLCKENNTTVSKLCKDIGISPGVQSKWKAGKLPSGETLLKISNELNVSVDYLLERTNKTEVNK